MKKEKPQSFLYISFGGIYKTRLFFTLNITLNYVILPNNLLLD